MLVIAVPVLSRPERVDPLVRSITDATSLPHRIVFICSPSDSDEIRSCRKSGQETIIAEWEPGPGDFAKKINLAYRRSDESFFLIAADDLSFHPGWDREALRVAEETNAGVIGTNDLHNPRVLKGQHSTHPLVRRAYIDEQGGTFDGSGDVLCELYDHQWVDDELCLTARLRGQWAFAHEARIEHLHPYFGLAEMDDTYRKALRASREDFRLFSYRQRELRRYLRRQGFRA